MRAIKSEKNMQLCKYGEAEGFDLVFSDVTMPGMNEIELSHEIHRRFPHISVVPTSGYSEVLAQEGTHCFSLVRKPYSSEVPSKTPAEAFAA